MENAVIYARYSSTNQTENSIEAQVSAAKEYARNKYNIIKIYADRAKTGTNDNREAFQEMLKDSSSKSFTVVIVWKVDRFGRNREEIAMNKYRLKKNGVHLEYVAENITGSPEGVILESVLEGFAEYYSRALSQNVKRGLLERRKNGFIAGGIAPLGYDLVNGKYEINKLEAKKIKDVFKMYASGARICDISDKTGVPMRTISHIIRNRTYIGIHTASGIEIPVPNIIDEKTFEMASKRIGEVKRRSKSSVKYLLSGKVVCKCGKRYSVSTQKYNDKVYRYYRPLCTCSRKKIKADELEEYVLKTLEEKLDSDELIDAIYEKVKLKAKKLNSSKSALTILEKKRDNIYKAIEDGLPFKDVKDRLDAIELEIAEKSKNLNTSLIISRQDVADRLSHIKSLNSTDAIIQNIIDKIVVNPDGLYEIVLCS